MKRCLVIFLVILMYLSLAGCDKIPPTTTATVCGYVTDTRGGGPLQGAQVKGLGVSVLTDKNGYFNIKVIPEEMIDLFVVKEGFAGVRIQDVCLKEGEELYLEIPIRKPFDPEQSITPPIIHLEGVKRGDVVKGNLDISVIIEGDDLDSFAFYVQFCGLQRRPVELRVIDLNEGRGTVNTKLFPNGKGFVKSLVYDANKNLTILHIPLFIDNDFDEPAAKIPADLHQLNVFSYTFGESLDYYSHELAEKFACLDIKCNPQSFLKNKEENNIKVTPENTTLFISLTWLPVDGADGYQVYRSLKDDDYELIGIISQELLDEELGVYSYEDFSPRLSPGKPVHYKVIPYNSRGNSQGLARTITPLMPFNINLSSPTDLASNVSLEPLFTWEMIGGPFKEHEVDYLFFLSSNTTLDFIYEDITGAQEFKLTKDIMQLEPGMVYSWDIVQANVYKHIIDETGEILVRSIAGTGEGALNGRRLFTTTLVGH